MSVGIGVGGRDRWVTATRRVNKPWGHEEIFAFSEGRYCGKALHVDAGQALSLQYHEAKEETIAVQSGSVVLEIGEHEDDLERVELAVGDSVHVPPGVRHRVTALTDSILLEASTTQLSDVVRIEDRYGREGTTSPWSPKWRTSPAAPDFCASRCSSSNVLSTRDPASPQSDTLLGRKP